MPIAQTPNHSAKPQSILRVVRNGAPAYLRIRDGKAGSYQTAQQMARLVREAAVRDQALEKRAAQILIANGLDSHSDPDQIIDAVFRYVQGIPYISDTTGQGNFDAIASASDTLGKGYGDCDDLSVLLASLLALVGFRPAFVLAKMQERSKGFDHVYVEVEGTKGRVALDPTTRKFGMGWESPRAIERETFPIFKAERQAQTLAGAGTTAVVTGAQIGLSFVPVVGPILSALAGPIASLFHGKSPQEIAAGRNFDSLDHDVAAFFHQINDNRQTVAPEDYLAAQNAVAALEHLAQQTSSVAYVRSQWAAEQPRYAAALQAIGQKVIQNPTGQVGTSQGTGNASAETLSSVSNALPVILGLGLIALVLLRR